MYMYCFSYSSKMEEVVMWENFFLTVGGYLPYSDLSLLIPFTKSRQWRSVTWQLSCQHWYIAHLDRTQSKPVKFGTYWIDCQKILEITKKCLMCLMKEKICPVMMYTVFYCMHCSIQCRRNVKSAYALCIKIWLFPTGKVKWINSYFSSAMACEVFVRKERLKRDIINIVTFVFKKQKFHIQAYKLYKLSIKASRLGKILSTL